MPLIPVPRGHGVVQVAALAVILVVIVMLLPVWLLCWTFPNGRALVLQILQRLEELLAVILTSDPAKPHQDVGPGPTQPDTP